MGKVWLMLGLCSVLVWPATSFAHALSVTHYPLGPLPVLMARWAGPITILVVPVALVVETLTLWPWARELGLKGNIWRGAVLYAVGRIAESACVIGLDLGAALLGMRPAGWGSTGEAIGSAMVCVLVGFIPKLMVASPLYRRAGLKEDELFAAVGAATLAGYLSGLALMVALTP